MVRFTALKAYDDMALIKKECTEYSGMNPRCVFLCISLYGFEMFTNNLTFRLIHSLYIVSQSPCSCCQWPIVLKSPSQDYHKKSCSNSSISKMWWYFRLYFYKRDRLVNKIQPIWNLVILAIWLFGYLAIWLFGYLAIFYFNSIYDLLPS